MSEIIATAKSLVFRAFSCVPRLAARIFFVLIFACWLAGCQPAQPAPPSQPSKPRYSLSPSDDSVLRLGDISDAMNLFCSHTGALPKEVAELRRADIGGRLDFTSPIDGQPYVYVPGGLVSPDSPDRIVMYDAARLADGGHWCIIMPPIKPGRVPASIVKQLSPAQFNAYKPAAP